MVNILCTHLQQAAAENVDFGDVILEVVHKTTAGFTAGRQRAIATGDERELGLVQGAFDFTP